MWVSVRQTWPAPSVFLSFHSARMLFLLSREALYVPPKIVDTEAFVVTFLTAAGRMTPIFVDHAVLPYDLSGWSRLGPKGI